MVAHICLMNSVPYTLAQTIKHGKHSAAADLTPSWNRNRRSGSINVITRSTYGANVALMLNLLLFVGDDYK